MEDNVINNNLAEMNEIFNNKTLTYRINSFARACNMTSLDITDQKTVKDGKVFYGYNQVLFNNKKNDKQAKYYIVVNNSNDNLFGRGVTISGYYDDLNFVFTNYYGFKKNLSKRILDLPFSMTLYKTIDNETYCLHAKTFDSVQTQFTITKSREYKDKTISSHVSFSANVMDFSNVLKLIKAFVYNPKLLYTTYDEIIESKKIVLTTTEFNKGVMQDTNLDKPMGKIKRKIKK